MRPEVLILLTVHVKRPDDTLGIGLRQQHYVEGAVTDVNKLARRYGHNPEASASIGSIWSTIKSSLGFSTGDKPHKVYIKHSWFGVDGQRGESYTEVPEENIRTNWKTGLPEITKLPVTERDKNDIAKMIGGSNDAGAYVFAHFVESTELISNAIPMNVMGEYLGELGLHALRKLNVVSCNLARGKRGERRLIAIGNAMREFCPDGGHGPALASYPYPLEIEEFERLVAEGVTEKLIKKFFDKDRNDNLVPKEEMDPDGYKIVAIDDGLGVGYRLGTIQEWTDKPPLVEEPETLLERRRQAVRVELENQKKFLSTQIANITAVQGTSGQLQEDVARELDGLNVAFETVTSHLGGTETEGASDELLTEIENFIEERKEKNPLQRRRSIDIQTGQWLVDRQGEFANQQDRLSRLSFSSDAESDALEELIERVAELQHELRKIMDVVAELEPGEKRQTLARSRESRKFLNGLEDTIKANEKQISALEDRARAIAEAHERAERERAQRQEKAAPYLETELEHIGALLARLGAITDSKAEENPDLTGLYERLEEERKNVNRYASQVEDNTLSIDDLRVIEEYFAEPQNLVHMRCLPGVVKFEVAALNRLLTQQEAAVQALPPDLLEIPLQDDINSQRARLAEYQNTFETMGVERQAAGDNVSHQMEEHPTPWLQERPLIESRQRLIDRLALLADIQAAQADMADMQRDLSYAKSIVVNHPDLMGTTDELETSLVPLAERLTLSQARIQGKVSFEEMDLVRGEVGILLEEWQDLRSRGNSLKAEAGKIRLQEDLTAEIEIVMRQLKRLGKIAAPQGEETKGPVEGLRRELEGGRAKLEQWFEQVNTPNSLELAQIEEIHNDLTVHRAQKYEEQLNSLAPPAVQIAEASEVAAIQSAEAEGSITSLPTHVSQASWGKRVLHAADKKLWGGHGGTSQLTVEGVMMDDEDKARLQNEFGLNLNNYREKLTKHPSRIGGFTYLFERPDHSWVVQLDGGVTSKVMAKRPYVTVLTQTQLAGRIGAANRHSEGFLTGEQEGQKRSWGLGRSNTKKGGDV
ncbi:MAG TPA: hypothetical protein VM532_00165 [Burkholderiales bacterium]|nr:hypothetical protein [Burkholderiales bacterium]